MNTEQKLFASLVGVLLGVGVLMVHSASITSWPSEFERIYLSRHVTFLAIGVGVAALCAYLPARIWYNFAPHFFGVTLLLLAAVLVPGVGTQVNGAQRWLRIGPFSMQPAELAKISLPLLTCRILMTHRSRLKHWFWGTAPVFVPVACVVPLVLRQPDLGTTVFLIVTWATALFFGGWPIRNFVAIGALGAPAMGYFLSLRPYQLKRITGFIAAWTDFQNAPYQVKQSLVTLGAGGITGVGVGKGLQKLSFLPEANTDFVFAVIGEELGLIGTLGLLLLWGGLYITGLRLLRRFSRQSFVYIAGLTLLTQLVVQAALNVAVVTALVPPKGIPLPLLSYGGSSLVTSLAALGIILSLSRAETDEMTSFGADPQYPVARSVSQVPGR